MATSGTTSFNLTCQQIIETACIYAGLLTEDADLDSYTQQIAKRILNSIIKHWQVQNYRLFCKEDVFLFVTPSQSTYTLSGTGDPCTRSYTATTLSASATSGSTSITITSATGFATSYNIGIVQDDSTVKWTTASNVVGTTVTLAGALTDDAASGNTVYAFASQITLPIDVHHGAYLFGGSSTGSLQPLSQISQHDEFMRPSSNTTGTPYTWTLYKSISSLSVRFWPVPTNPLDVIKLKVTRTVEDFTNNADTPDFSVEWLEPLQLELAARLALIKEKEEQYARLAQQANQALINALSFDQEKVDIRLRLPGD